MSLTRRALLRRTAVLGLVPASSHLIACSDDGGGGSDVGAFDVGSDADVGADVATDVPEELPELPEYEYDGPMGPESTFSYGIASGDPLPNGIILWTHAQGEDDSPVEVWWEVSETADFTRRVQVGTYQTDSDRDFTVKVDVAELRANGTYYYRFKALGRTSQVGRLRTAPDGPVDRLRFAVMSCSSYAHGYFHAYGRVAERNDLHAVLHLGDYIYEYGTGQYGSIREYEPAHEIITLEDYRTRYRHYRKDLELQAIHRQHPFIVVWDDHETADNSWMDGANNHSPDLEGSWEDRKTAAIQAFNEWIPIRTNPDDESQIFRSFEYGDLAEIVMLDTRLWGRDLEAERTDVEGQNDPERTLLGDDQEEWFHSQVRDSTATWKIIGQQVMMAHWRGAGNPGPIFNPDQWDGYAPTRDRFLDVVEGESIDNIVVLTGDIHTSWANDVVRDPYTAESYNGETGEGSLLVEFVTPGVSSPGLGSLGDIVGPALKDINPHVKFADLEHRGYIVLDVTEDHCQAEWYHIEDVEVTETAEFFAAAYKADVNTNHLVMVDGPSTPPNDAPDPAPES